MDTGNIKTLTCKPLCR